MSVFLLHFTHCLVVVVAVVWSCDEGTVNNYSQQHLRFHSDHPVTAPVSSVQQAYTIGGPQHAEEFQRERRDLLSGAHGRQPIRHGAGLGGRRQQEEALQLERAGGRHRWQPAQPQHLSDQWPW